MADGYLVDDADIKKIAELVKTGDKELANNIKALQYIIDNSNRLNYTGQVITNSNSVVGDIKNVTVRGNTRYKKTDGTYTDAWESGVSLESMGETEKNNSNKYPIIIKSSNDTKEDRRTILLDEPLRKTGEVADILDLDKSQITRKSHKIVLDNNIGGYETNSKNGKKGYNITLSKKAKDGKLICDKLPVINEYIVWEETIGIYIKNNEIIIYHNGESLADFKTWLVSNPITVVYELATPTIEDIEVSPTDNPLQSYNDNTTLTLNNAIKGSISADMPTNVNAIITQQASAIASLQDTVLQTQSALIENEYNNLI